MEWLKNTINGFEAKKEEEQKKQAEEKAAREKQMSENRKTASDCLSEIYKLFYNIKKEIHARKYPCEVDLGSAIDAHTGQQHNTSATLIVNNKPLRHGDKLSSGTHAHMIFSENHMSDSLSIKFRHSGQEETKSGSIPFSKVNKETIEDMISKFIKGVFS